MWCIARVGYSGEIGDEAGTVREAGQVGSQVCPYASLLATFTFLPYSTGARVKAI